MNRQEVEEKLVKMALEDVEFKKQLIKDPKAMIEKELGKTLPENVTVEVIEETSAKTYIRIPANSEELSEDDLENVAGGLLCFNFASGW